MDYINNVLERLKNKQTRASTAENYLSIWRHLNIFLISLDTKENLSWEEKTALFGTYLVDGGVQSSTLKSYFSAIKHILKQDGYPWDDNKAILSSLVRGCCLENDKVKVRLPIQKSLLELLLFESERFFNESAPQPYLEILYKTIFCLAYYGMMRVGELTWSPHTVKACNIHVGHNKDKIQVVLYTSKIALCRLRWFKLNVSKYQKDVKLSKRCQVVKKMLNVKKSNMQTMEEVH